MPAGAGQLSVTSGNRIGYAGYQFDPATEQYHVRHRVYSPEMGRWTRRDPLGYLDGMGLLQYCSARPLTEVDPTGLTSAYVFTSRNAVTFAVEVPGLFVTTEMLTTDGRAAREYPPFDPRTIPIDWIGQVPWRDAGLSRGNCWRYATCRPASIWMDHEGGIPGGGLAESCEELEHRISRGACNFAITPGAIGDACPAGSWKVCYLDGSPFDEHYVRQEIDGSWTHKPGGAPPRDTDCGTPPQVIADPRTADWRCSRTNPLLPDYEFCGCFCRTYCP